MKSLFLQTKGEKAGTIDGLNLFFGALLGANLGTIGRMPLGDYVELVLLLGALVMGLRIVSTSERRLLAVIMLVLVGGIAAYALGTGDFDRSGFSDGAFQRLQATLAIWVIGVLLVEISPTYDPRPGPSAAEGQAGETPDATRQA